MSIHIQRGHRFPVRSTQLLLIAASLFASPFTAAAPPPTIKLFPTTVLEEIRETGSIAQQMESGLQTVIGRLDKQQQLYRASKCEGGADDPGCEQIARQIGAAYLEMLNTMSERLPEMETAVKATTASLQKRIHKELGQKRTAWAVQELLLGEGGSGGEQAQQPVLRGRSGMRLSSRFNQYYKLVARAGGKANASLAVIASDIYLDMDETARLIERTREEIARATLMEQLNQSFGTITPEMQEVVSGVKTILFGEQEEVTPIAERPPEVADQAYQSPLQL